MKWIDIIVENPSEFLLNPNISDSQHHHFSNGKPCKYKNIPHSNTTNISQGRVIFLSYIIIYTNPESLIVTQKNVTEFYLF